MSRSELLAKIRKCLALAASANEHEAATALAIARRLMDEHGVDEVEAATIDVGEAPANGNGALTPAAWETDLVHVVTHAIPAEPLYGVSGWIFVGLTPAPEIAAYAFTALFRQLKRARVEYIRTHLKRVTKSRRKTQRADAFCEGWVNAVAAKIARLYPRQRTDDLVRAYLAHRYPRTAAFDPRGSALRGSVAANDRGRGWSAGREVELRQGVGQAAKPLKLGRAA
jgi:hypothetical protein